MLDRPVPPPPCARAPLGSCATSADGGHLLFASVAVSIAYARQFVVRRSLLHEACVKCLTRFETTRVNYFVCLLAGSARVVSLNTHVHDVLAFLRCGRSLSGSAQHVMRT